MPRNLKQWMLKPRSRAAQAGTELAVFGSVLIFVLAFMVRQGINLTQNQNLYYKTFRMALKSSMLTAEDRGFISHTTNENNAEKKDVKYWTTEDSAARNFANILLIEDRLSSEITRFGSLERSPYIMQARGTYSKNHFLPVDAEEYHSLNRMDVYINGRHFVFTTAGFVKYDLGLKDTSADNKTPDHNSGKHFAEKWAPFRNEQVEKMENCMCEQASFPEEDCGCRLIYESIVNTNYIGRGQEKPNNPEDPDWCWDGSQSACDKNDAPENMLGLEIVDHVFDLDRDGTPDVPPAGIPMDVDEARWMFSWQWRFKKSLAANITVDLKKAVFDSYDVDGDTHEEAIILPPMTNAKGVATEVYVIDQQEGDIDVTWSPQSGKPQPGLAKDVQVFTLTRDGTYLEVMENSYVADPQTKVRIRNVRKRDQVDIIQRTFQLSNDTGRFCRFDNGAYTRRSFVDGGINPVEACEYESASSDTQINPCFNQINITLNCMYRRGVEPPVIFVRSRILDQGGRKWITDLGEGEI